LPGGERFHLTGFSFGGVLGGHVAALLGDQVRSFTIVGSNGLGLPRQPTELERQKPGATVEELLAIARHNLGVLMIADKNKIDDLAVYIQYMNAPRGRVRSRRFSRTDTLIRALPRVTAQLSGIWGGRDAGAYPYLDERKRVLDEIQPGLRFEIIPGAGHWVAYEAADRFNPILAEIAGS
jgi:2-hydroxy-6-oxonona-2,4-dienedioate hydrolase